MSLPLASDPKVSYSARVVQLKDGTLYVLTGAEDFGKVAKVQNMSIKMFRKEPRKMQNREYYKAFQLIEMSNMDCRLEGKRSADPKLILLVKGYSDVFCRILVCCRNDIIMMLPGTRSFGCAFE
jgi:hypothetical protein